MVKGKDVYEIVKEGILKQSFRLEGARKLLKSIGFGMSFNDEVEE
jgi:hypothetical protein